MNKKNEQKLKKINKIMMITKINIENEYKEND